MRVIDLRSDTVTLPTPEMREAMRTAELGDDFYREDPTVRRLEERAADLLGKEAALLVLSGTMGNLVSILAQTHRGDRVLAGDASHIYQNECGNLGALASLSVQPIPAADGMISPGQIEAARAWNPILQPPVRIVCLENTHNAGGGKAIPVSTVEAVCDAAHALAMRVHVDGARIFNAACALGRPAADLVRSADSATFCLSKGLGCPAGSVVVAEAGFLEELRRWRQTVGGGMRQAGIFAAAGLVALDHMIERLVEDHDNARTLARGIAEIGLPADPGLVETNMVFVDLRCAAEMAVRFVAALREVGVLVNPPKGARIRFVTHHDVSKKAIAEAIEAIARVAKPLLTGSVAEPQALAGIASMPGE